MAAAAAGRSGSVRGVGAAAACGGGGRQRRLRASKPDEEEDIPSIGYIGHRESDGIKSSTTYFSGGKKEEEEEDIPVLRKKEDIPDMDTYEDTGDNLGQQDLTLGGCWRLDPGGGGDGEYECLLRRAMRYGAPAPGVAALDPGPVKPVRPRPRSR
ncbi:autophagy-related protein 3-like [Panicum miliaceum]|uniref:Autophagy-related protein 3-like n=1 Tax=Panicum miliaceum TaxID=4540 RepID=A0A3L6RXN3_PANMI|nr:autophagy-related protein 3-like [Panicum miliaceum]